MAVVAMWMCDRDNSMFEDKKQADAYDKMLELAEHFTALLESQISGIDDKAAEDFGLLLAKNKDQLIAACKGKPELLGSLGDEVKVTAIDSAKTAAN